jgi:hypothetical protein
MTRGAATKSPALGTLTLHPSKTGDFTCLMAAHLSPANSYPVGREGIHSISARSSTNSSLDACQHRRDPTPSSLRRHLQFEVVDQPGRTELGRGQHDQRVAFGGRAQVGAPANCHVVGLPAAR